LDGTPCFAPLGSERYARRALEALRALLAELGLRPKEAKTRIVHAREGGERL
jgi:RNA-directed DNA polymerase